MDWQDFLAAVTSGSAPQAEPLVLAMWHAARGEWERAHAIAQDEPDPDGAWVHAHLHRQEGDSSNARYWYRRAGREEPSSTLADEREAIVRELLSR